MSNLPLELHEMLEEEYISIYGSFDRLRSDVTFTETDILHQALAQAVIEACALDASKGVIYVLNVLLYSDSLDVLHRSPLITPDGEELIKNYKTYATGVTLSRRQEINRRIVDEAFAGAVRPLRVLRLGCLYKTLDERSDEEARTALCISGGGIRSATFALGVIQGLAGAKILDKFHYMSTVSGGGYIGSWLSSWARRHPYGISGVQEDLARGDTAVEGTQDAERRNSDPSVRPDTTVEESRFVQRRNSDPEPLPVRRLREWGANSGKWLILSADTWTMASLYIRHLVLNLLVLVPILAAILMVPRLFALLLRPGLSKPLLLNITVAALAVAFGYLGMSRPTVHGGHAGTVNLRGSGGFMLFHVVPLTVAATTLSLYWAEIASASFSTSFARDWMYYAAAGDAMTLLPAGIYCYRFFVQSSAAGRREQSQYGRIRKFGAELLASIVSLGILGTFLYFLATTLFDQPLRPIDFPSFLRGVDDVTRVPALYVGFVVPIILLVFFVQHATFAGVSSKVNQDYDGEWWSRGGAMLLMSAISLAVLCFIAVYGPVLLYRISDMGNIPVGSVSSLVTALLGFVVMRANEKQKKEKSGASTAVVRAILAVAVPLFVVVFLSAISLGTTALIRLHSKAPQSVKGGGNAAPKPATPPQSTLISAAEGKKYLETINSTKGSDVIWIPILLAAAVVLSLSIRVQRFSVSATYRNRMIRAFLGASRYARDLDSFTGFDPHDDLQMYELRPELLWKTGIGDLAAFVEQLTANCTMYDSVEQTIWNALDRTTRRWLEEKRPLTTALMDALIQNVNHILVTKDLGGGNESEPGAERVIRNRSVLQATFSQSLQSPQRAPIHVINTAFSQAATDQAAWQDRRAQSFTISPLHCGSSHLGYRDSKSYGGASGISLASAVTISSASAKASQGFHSSPALAFALAVLNIRLGHDGARLGNPGLAGRKTSSMARPAMSLEPLLWEVFGSRNDQSSFVHLSDGGNFENLGIYEMVLRRCRYIVAIDASCDPQFAFADLGNAIRKIRADLGIPIEFQFDEMHPRTDNGLLRKGKYVMIGRIRYSAIDYDAVDGVLVYIKPGLYDDAYFPKDVYNYASESAEFPHESTGDQFFSESQFESYRALGRHALNQICGNYESGKATFANTYSSVAAFVNDVRQNAARSAAVPAEQVIKDFISLLTKAVDSARGR